MNYRQAFPSKFLRPEDIGAGQPIVQIEAVAVERVGQDERLVVSFIGKTKRLTLNRTNAAVIAELAGSDETAAWPGTRVRLFTERVLFQGRMVPALRVGAVAPPPVPPAVPPAPTTGWGDEDPGGF